jgi:hypothetical protein
MSKGHHLIMGQLIDYLTGQTLSDTHDERYRQKIARLLVEAKGYLKSDLTPGRPLEIKADRKCARVPVTLIVALEGRICMIVQYGPGSLVTRHRPALAMGRLVAPYQVPVVVVTNGEQADILDGPTGRVIDTGLAGIPHRLHLLEMMQDHSWTPISQSRTDMEARIVMAFEVDDRCPCDDTVCMLKAV